MADVRALLKEQQAARRISHPHVTYSTTGRLICLVCNLQLKSESLWAGHQRSPNHQKKLQEAEQNTTAAVKPSSDGSEDSGKTITQDTVTNAPNLKRPQGPPKPGSESPSKKRKAQWDEIENDDEADFNETLRKRSKSAAQPAPPKPKHIQTLPGFLPEGFFDNDAGPQDQEEAQPEAQERVPKTPAAKKDNVTPPMPNGEFTLASRPLTPMDTSRSTSGSGSKPLTPMDVGTPSKSSLSRSTTLAAATSADAMEGANGKEDKTQAQVDEDEWAAFEADIAAAEAMPEDAVITAAPVSAEELANMTVEESYLSKRERLEREREQEKEDIINKALDEQEEMRELEARVAKMKARTEEVKKLREQVREKPVPEVAEEKKEEEEDEEDDSDLDEDDEDWLRG